MKKILLVLTGLALSLSSVSFAYQSDYGCRKKEQNLRKQLSYAEQYNNVHRAENLRRAIANVQQYCGNHSYSGDNNDFEFNDDVYKQSLNKKILNQQKKVAEAKYELEEAKLSGKPKKIRNKTEKLQERQNKLNYYLKERDSL